MTTNLTEGRPQRLPFDTERYYFHPEEFGRLFPERVVRWMIEHPRRGEDPSRNPDECAPLRPLPNPADLPVVVAARLSLSFPLLLSAVPLYAIDYSRKLPEGERKPEVCWFSDGGIVSNFPVHFFDRPVPRWPTFAINLRRFHPDYPPGPDERDNVYLPASNTGGILAEWRRFRGVPGFLSAIADTTQNWLDNAQLQQPGYRDRIAHIHLAEHEGGANLRMSGDVIRRLSERGRWAGRRLTERFASPSSDPSQLSWDNHRWVRYRSFMSLFERMLSNLRAGYLGTQPGDRSYAELIGRSDAEPPSSYRWSGADQRAFAAEATEAVVELAAEWESQDERFSEGAARPEPELRVVPRV